MLGVSGNMKQQLAFATGLVTCLLFSGRATGKAWYYPCGPRHFDSLELLNSDVGTPRDFIP